MPPERSLSAYRYLTPARYRSIYIYEVSGKISIIFTSLTLMKNYCEFTLDFFFNFHQQRLARNVVGVLHSQVIGPSENFLEN